MFTLTPIDTDSLSISAEILECIAHSCDRESEYEMRGVVQLSVISDEEMRDLNTLYRQKPQTTDVLSFHYFDDFADIGAEEVAGEVVFSLSCITRQASIFEETPEEEWYRLLIHSLFHLVGYDHEEEVDFLAMYQKECIVIDGVNQKFDLNIQSTYEMTS